MPANYSIVTKGAAAVLAVLLALNGLGLVPLKANIVALAAAGIIAALL